MSFFDTLPHTHKCGFTLFSNGPEADNAPMGCGFEWEHARTDFQNGAQFAKGHFCPNCGLGPWVWQYGDETAHQAKQTASERMIRDLNQFAIDAAGA